MAKSTALQLIPLREAAERLSSGLSTVRGWIEEGRLPAFKVGRRVMVAESDLQAMVERGRIVMVRKDRLQPADFLGLENSSSGDLENREI